MLRLILHIGLLISVARCRLYGEKNTFAFPKEFPEFEIGFSGFSDYVNTSSPGGLLKTLHSLQGISAKDLATRFCDRDFPGVSDACAQSVRELNCGFVDFIGGALKDCKNGSNQTDICECEAAKNNAMTNNMWTVGVLDSFGKIPSAILNGDFQWMGTYSACVNTHVTLPARVPGAIPPYWDGKYCTASFSETVSNHSATLLSKCANTPTVPGCKPPGTTISIKIGICLPQTCSERDLNTLLNYELSSWGIKGICNAEISCQNPTESEGSIAAFTIVMLICAIHLLLITGATLFDLYVYQNVLVDLPENRSERPNPPAVQNSEQLGRASCGSEILGPGVTNSILSTGSAPSLLSLVKTKAEYYNELAWYWKTLLAFSAYTNGTKLLTAKTGPEDMSCLHGIRVLSMAWVILGHVYYFSVRFLDNTAVMRVYPKSFSWQIINNATVSVDTFFVLSGFLLCYLWLKKVKPEQLKSLSFWTMYYVHRIIRLTPTYMLILAVGITVFPRLGAGPMWLGANENIIKNCHKSWWSNLFYVNNFFYVKSEEMCIGWTWYLADDMQFYAFAPVLLVLLFVFPIAGIVLAVILMIISALIRAILVVNNNYPPTVITTVDPAVFYGLEEFGVNIYFKPYTRWSTFILGMLLGYIYYKSKGNLRLPKGLAFLIWVGVLLITIAVIFGLYSYSSGEIELSGTVKGLYAAINRPLWGVAVCTLIYLCLQDHGGIANTFLSWKIWVPVSRLTYCAYLIHPFVIIFFYSTLKRPEHAETFNYVYHFLAILVVTYTLSIVLCLAFESPVIQLEKLWMDPTMWKKQRSTGFEPVKDRLAEVRSQLQEGLRKMQVSRDRTEVNSRNCDVEMEMPVAGRNVNSSTVASEIELAVVTSSPDDTGSTAVTDSNGLDNHNGEQEQKFSNPQGH